MPPRGKSVGANKPKGKKTLPEPKPPLTKKDLVTYRGMEGIPKDVRGNRRRQAVDGLIAVLENLTGHFGPGLTITLHGGYRRCLALIAKTEFDDWSVYEIAFTNSITSSGSSFMGDTPACIGLMRACERYLQEFFTRPYLPYGWTEPIDEKADAEWRLREIWKLMHSAKDEGTGKDDAEAEQAEGTGKDDAEAEQAEDPDEDNWKPEPERVRAVLTTDDGRSEVTFNAAWWLADADVEDIKALAAKEWKNCELADAVAYAAETHDRTLAEVFRMCRAAHRGNPEHGGFEVEVDEFEAMYWLAKHLPGVHDEVKASLPKPDPEQPA